MAFIGHFVLKQEDKARRPLAADFLKATMDSHEFRHIVGIWAVDVLASAFIAHPESSEDLRDARQRDALQPPAGLLERG
jgi:hypothetical protein